MKLNEAIFMVLRDLRNAFEGEKEEGVYAVKDDAINLKNEYKPGMWIAITGSVLNDGLYVLKKTSVSSLWQLTNGTDDDSPVQNEESFNGSVWRLKPPGGFITLCKEIAEWFDSEAGRNRGVVSESVLGFHKVEFAMDKNGQVAGWDTLFANRIPGSWRKMWQTTAATTIFGGQND